MSSYVVGVIDKQDREKYETYVGAGFQSIDGFDVKVTLAEQPEVLEGHFPGTTMIIMEFKCDDDARKWFDSDAYQAARVIRHASARTPFMIHFKA